MLQMGPFLLEVHLNSPGKAVYDSAALLLWDGSDFLSDSCLEFRDGLRVVFIHSVLQITPPVEIWGGSDQRNVAPTQDLGDD